MQEEARAKGFCLCVHPCTLEQYVNIHMEKRFGTKLRGLNIHDRYELLFVHLSPYSSVNFKRNVFLKATIVAFGELAEILACLLHAESSFLKGLFVKFVLQPTKHR